VDDAGLPPLSDDLPELSALPAEDIPVAVRETSLGASSLTDGAASSQKRPSLFWGLLSLAAIAAVALPLVFAFRPQTSTAEAPAKPTEQTPTVASTTSLSETDGEIPESAEDSLLGHLPYEEAPASDLVPLPPDGRVSLRKAAAEQFKAMAAAAKADGVILVPLSGYRSLAEQDDIFFGVKAERGEAPSKRAEVSAPPGYSEHHTGYAIDIGDGDHPGSDLQFDFEETEAFKWLKENAAFYSFELSFPKGNPMGVSYEPWHWRFVGDRHSLETFYRARSGDTSAQPVQPEASTSPDRSNAANAGQAR